MALDSEIEWISKAAFLIQDAVGACHDVFRGDQKTGAVQSFIDVAMNDTDASPRISVTCNNDPSV